MPNSFRKQINWFEANVEKKGIENTETEKCLVTLGVGFIIIAHTELSPCVKSSAVVFWYTAQLLSSCFTSAVRM